MRTFILEQEPEVDHLRQAAGIRKSGWDVSVTFLKSEITPTFSVIQRRKLQHFNVNCTFVPLRLTVDLLKWHCWTHLSPVSSLTPLPLDMTMDWVSVSYAVLVSSGGVFGFVKAGQWFIDLFIMVIEVARGQLGLVLTNHCLIPWCCHAGSVVSLIVGLLFGLLAALGAYMESQNPQNIWLSLGECIEFKTKGFKQHMA